MSVTFEKRSGRYLVRIRRRGLPEISRTFDRKADAEAFNTKALKDIFDQKDLGKKVRHTLSAAVEKYLDEEVPHQRSKDRTESNARALLPHIKDLYIDQIDRATKNVRASTRTRGDTKKPLTVATINRRLAILRRVANLAYQEWHWLDREIAVRLLPEHNKRHEYLTPEEVHDLAWHCAEPMNHMIWIAAYTGMREGNIYAMDESNIWNDKDIFVGLTKNGKPILLPIVPLIKKHLEAWIALKERPHMRTLYKYFKRAAEEIGRPDLHFHDLRHTTASFLLNAGHGIATVAEVLNCTIQNAQRYAHLSMENKRNALLDIAKKPKRVKKSGVKLPVNENAGKG